MNIWIIANADFPNGRGGTPRIRNIAFGLVSLGHNVRLLIPHAAGYVGKNQNIHVKGSFGKIVFEFLNGQVDRPRQGTRIVIDKLIGNIKMFFRLLFDEKPRCIIIYNYSLFDTGLVILLAKYLRISIIFDVCDERFDIHAIGQERNILRNINILNAILSDKLLFLLADGFFVVSTYLNKKISKFGRSQPVMMLPLIANMTLLPVEKSHDHNDYQVAYMGSLIPDEGVEMLIDAIAIVKREFPTIQCDITGGANNPDFENVLKKKICDKGLERTVNIVPNIPYEKVTEYLMSKTLLLLPRPNTTISQAGFPGKVAEYICSQRPIVTTDFGDIRLYFTDLESAFISKDATAESFAATCIFALKNTEIAEQVGNKALQIGMQKFELKNISNDIENFIRQLK